MKVKEVIETLQQLNQDDEVFIEKPVRSYIGSRPGYPIKHIYPGFDWDKGRVFIQSWRKVK